MKLQSKNQTLYLELAAIIVQNRHLEPELVSSKQYQEEIFKQFNKTYEVEAIDEELDILLGNNQEEKILIYPDDHFEGF